MPAWTNQAALDVLAAFVVVLVIGGVASGFSQSVRRLVFTRIGGAIYRAVTDPSRTADRRAAAKVATAERLQEALKDLGDAIFQGWDVQAEKAAARVRMLCPATRAALDALLNDLRHINAPQDELHKKLDAVRDSASDCLAV
jgi:hypothetical protein